MRSPVHPATQSWISSQVELSMSISCVKSETFAASAPERFSRNSDAPHGRLR